LVEEKKSELKKRPRKFNKSRNPKAKTQNNDNQNSEINDKKQSHDISPRLGWGRWQINYFDQL
jgi:hypothetical protein